MSTATVAQDVLDRNFLDIRSRLIDIAAALDRIDRAEGAEHAQNDTRLVRIRESLQILAGEEGRRAERVLMVFSDPYEPNWRDQ
ncbi:MAG TPA: hypothetical protein EYP14_05935 [Planctomycetaceae bacterium]|nr:hypothetical protein [Planctomycetaceae bacterium]